MIGFNNLIKLKIAAYSDAACTQSLNKSIDAFLNPESYSLNYAVNYESSKEKQNNAGTQIFTGVGPTGLELDLTIDGTGIIPLPAGYMDIDSYVSDLKDIIYTYQGTYHRPNYLKVAWKNLQFTCVCESFTLKYSLFKPDGTPIRASVKLKFKENIDFKTKLRMAQSSSPDLTHVRTVKAGDTLPLMAYRIYGDSAYYTEVAKANNLTHFAAIRPGDELYFPPLKKNK
jgi:nucleoid-associated protein YgaU